MIFPEEQRDWPGLQTAFEREEVLLAPYAMCSRESAGRRYSEQEHPYRGPYQRDHDRVLHSSAYRRLSDKTQVFTGETGDYHRTRLTHTLEVASIARTIGRALRLNEDLIEALSLLHDIGHPPFGHAGEDALNECLVDVGGFSHNQYALCLVEELELRYHDFPGLNLTREVLDGQLGRAKKLTGQLLEAQIVDVADSVTYDSHDTDDAVQSGLISLHDLLETSLVREARDRVMNRRHPVSNDLLRKLIVHELIDLQVGHVLSASGPELARRAFPSAAAARESDFRIGPEAALASKKSELERFLFERVYHHPELVRVRQTAQDQLRRMFVGYVGRPELLPARFQSRIERVGLERSVGDYLAGMTDRFCQQQYQRYFATSAGG